ncbi:hypothetical protein HK103_006311 [Boothiomyces macroporosus]|uniref:Beta-lactamase-related domain-containing protein n=1 Tax=Boothiomyces macroporosus TaxID=261099 RepID=A0AAD5Y4Q1_9FUNG|nr:hypothetical protein HK103_006311 [Boothiomyces macroporosus]
MNDKLKFKEAELPSAILNFLEDKFEKDKETIPGAIFTVVHNRKAIVQKAHGYADAELKLPPFTAALLLTLWEQNGLSARDITHRDVNDIIQGLESKCPELSLGFRVDNNNFTEPITIWNLLTHTAGLEDAFQNVFVEPHDVPELQEIPPRLLNRANLLGNAFPKRIFGAGAVASYSNSGFALLGYIIELLAGKSYPDALKEYLFDPLEMTKTTGALYDTNDPVIIKAELPRTHADSLLIAQPHHTVKDSDGKYSHKLLPQSQRSPCLILSGGGIVSTGEDMAKFMICLMNDGMYNSQKVIGSLAIKLMMDKQFEAASQTWNNAGTVQRFYPHYKGLEIITHNGYLNGLLSDLILIPRHNLAIFYSINHEMPNFGVSVLLDCLFESVSEDQVIERMEFLHHEDPHHRKVEICDFTKNSIDLFKYQGTYLNCRRLDSKWQALVSMFGESDEISVTVSKDKKSLVLDFGQCHDLIPVTIGDDPEIHFWLKYNGSASVPRKPFPIVQFSDFKFSNGKSSQFLTYFYTSQKIQWYDRRPFLTVLGFAPIVGAGSQIVYSVLKVFLLHKIISFPKVSVGSLAVALGITSMYTGISWYLISSKNTWQVVSRKTPAWLKSVAAVSQITASIGGVYLITKLLVGNRRSLQDIAATVSAGAFFSIITRWNGQFWKM